MRWNQTLLGLGQRTQYGCWFLVQLVSQTPNGAMHHRASEARSQYVMMHPWEGKAGSSEGKLFSAQDFSAETSSGDLASITEGCCCIAAHWGHVHCLFPRLSSEAEHPALT